MGCLPARSPLARPTARGGVGCLPTWAPVWRADAGAVRWDEGIPRRLLLHGTTGARGDLPGDLPGVAESTVNPQREGVLVKSARDGREDVVPRVGGEADNAGVRMEPAFWLLTRSAGD